MTRSANEIMVLAAKAARGAGAPPAQAAQFGAAALYHLCAGGAPDLLDAALFALPAGPIVDIPLQIARCIEAAQSGQVALPFAATHIPLARSYVAALPYKASLTAEGALVIDLGSPAPRPEVSRIDLPPRSYAHWTAFAARLLVPESDASRSSGAGAGLSDND